MIEKNHLLLEKVCLSKNHLIAILNRENKEFSLFFSFYKTQYHSSIVLKKYDYNSYYNQEGQSLEQVLNHIINKKIPVFPMIFTEGLPF